MNKALLFTLVLASAPVVAQPVTRPDACGATIAYAPDDVRLVVEEWLRQESSCNATLEIRIVPTDGGLYLFARDERGRVRERLVPDAQAAAVLVTSWMADDSKLPAPPRRPVLPERFVQRTDAELVDSAPVIATPPRRRERMLGVGLLFEDQVVGIRAELDAVVRGGWSFGASVSYATFDVWVWDDPNVPWRIFDVADTTVTGYVVRRLQWGRWQFRPAVGIGVTYVLAMEELRSTGGTWEPQMYEVDEALVLTKEASFTLGRSIGDNWQVDVGPRVFSSGRGPGGLRRDTQGSLFAALRYRL